MVVPPIFLLTEPFMARRTTRNQEQRTAGRRASHARSSKAAKMSARSGKSPRPGGPLDAAYAVGRLLNQLDWHLQQAWLLPASDCKEARRHAATVGDILTQLRLTLRQATSGTVRERMHEVILG